MSSRLRFLWVVALSVVLGGGCSGSSGGWSASTTLGARDAVHGETFEFMVTFGVTESEAECVAQAVVDRVQPGKGLDELTAGYSSLQEVVTNLAPGCVPEARLAELERAAGSLAGLEIYMPRLLAGGASVEEAECMARALSVAPEDRLPTFSGVYEPGDPRLAIFDRCGSPVRMAAIYTKAYRAPLRAELIQAGASDVEASCIVDRIDQLDLFLPSSGFNQPGDMEATADLFIAEAAACASEDRLTTIASGLHT
jgi:hypothetical protein